MTNDMTKGSPIKLILSFMVPLLIGNIFQQFYNMADTIIVGRTISVEALAAVGASVIETSFLFAYRHYSICKNQMQYALKADLFYVIIYTYNINEPVLLYLYRCQKRPFIPHPY